MSDEDDREEISEELEYVLKAVGVIFEAMKTKQFAELVAEAYKNLFDAFVEKGFTEEQAIDILCRMKMGSN